MVTIKSGPAIPSTMPPTTDESIELKARSKGSKADNRYCPDHSFVPHGSSSRSPRVPAGPSIAHSESQPIQYAPARLSAAAWILPGAAIPTSPPQLADDCPIIYGVDHQARTATIHCVRHRTEAHRGPQDQALRRPNNSMEPTRPARRLALARYWFGWPGGSSRGR